MMATRLALTYLAGVLLTWTPSAAAQTAPEQILRDVRYLSADERQGRGVGTAGLDSAAAYLAREFQRIGLEPAGSDGYFQDFELDPSAPSLAHAGVTAAAVRNVLGLIPGKGPLADEVVVIGAHYDHLGLGGFGSLDPDSTGVVHNGADDNASGTAALLQIARYLSERDPPNHRTFLFIAFTAEELGLIGSSHYVKNPVVPNDSVFAMLNLDMVGRLRNGRLAIFGTESAEEFDDLLAMVNDEHQLVLATQGDGFGRSDHSSFFAAKIPVLHFFTGTHQDYHRTTDDWPRISARGIDRVAGFAADLAMELATLPEQLAFVDAAPPVQAVSGGYGAYLGTVPDMTESPGGVRLTGVRAGSPAEEAGLLAGDIITRIGEFEVADLYDMTDALRAYKPGDRVVIGVRRDEQDLEFEAELGSRGG